MTAVVDFVRVIPSEKPEAAVIATRALANADPTIRRVRTLKRVEAVGADRWRVTLAVEADS